MIRVYADIMRGLRAAMVSAGYNRSIIISGEESGQSDFLLATYTGGSSSGKTTGGMLHTRTVDLAWYSSRTRTDQILSEQEAVEKALDACAHYEKGGKTIWYDLSYVVTLAEEADEPLFTYTLTLSTEEVDE